MENKPEIEEEFCGRRWVGARGSRWWSLAREEVMAGDSIASAQRVFMSCGHGYVHTRDVKVHRIEGATAYCGPKAAMIYVVTDDGKPISRAQVQALIDLSE